jgi:hypothetical protein
MKKYFVFLFIICVILFSCERENEILDSTQKQIATETFNIEGIEVGSENGYLVFNNTGDVSKLARLLSDYSDSELENFCDKLKYTSAYVFLEKESMKATSLTDEKELLQILDNLKSLGYFREGDKEVKYPFYNTLWHAILNKEGIVKIDNVIYRFFGDDKLYNEDNDLQKLLNIRSKNDYVTNDVLVNNGSFPGLKSLTVTKPYCVLSQDHEDGYEVRYDDGPQQTANSEYRIKSKMWFSSDFPPNTVCSNWFTLEYICQKKGFLGIWWNDADYMYRKLYAMNFGGNSANTSGTITHKLYEEYTSPVQTSGSSKSQHTDHFYIESYEFAIPYSNYMPPVCTQSSHQYWNNHVTTHWWMTIHD